MNPHSSTTFRVEKALELAQSAPARHVFTSLYTQQALVQAQQCDAARSCQEEPGALRGWVVSLKDNLDVSGETTLAGSEVCRGEAAAAHDAIAVSRLRAAGAVFLGKTNMSEFAFSGVGINPHYGTPVNPCDARGVRIPGGSSSGAAVSVALGLADVGIGTDTGGSLRIPAAMCGLVGFKSTQARIPRDGVMPLALSLDTVGAIGRGVSEVLRVESVMSQQALGGVSVGLQGRRFAVPQTLVLDDLEPAVAQAFESALVLIRAAGAQVVDVPWQSLADIAKLSLPAGISPVEAYRAHRARLMQGQDRMDPRVVARMRLGQDVTEPAYQELLDRRRAWIAESETWLRAFDAVLFPTVPLVPPLLAPLIDNDEAFFRVNRLLLRNPSTINYLDGCSFSLPCQEPGALPVGLMVSAPAGQDAHLAALALSLETLLAGRNRRCRSL